MKSLIGKRDMKVTAKKTLPLNIPNFLKWCGNRDKMDLRGIDTKRR